MRKYPAMTAIFGAIALIGITVAAGTVYLFIYDEHLGVFESTASIRLDSLAALSDGNELVIAGTIQNTGRAEISEVMIDSIVLPGITIHQDEHAILYVSDGTDTSAYCVTGDGTCGTASASGAGAVHAIPPNDFAGFSIHDAASGVRTVSRIPVDESGTFILALSPEHPDLTMEEPEKLLLTLAINSEGNTGISDAYGTRVKIS